MLHNEFIVILALNCHGREKDEGQERCSEGTSLNRVSSTFPQLRIMSTKAECCYRWAPKSSIRCPYFWTGKAITTVKLPADDQPRSLIIELLAESSIGSGEHEFSYGRREIELLVPRVNNDALTSKQGSL